MLKNGERIVITGVGLAAPNGNSLPEFRDNQTAIGNLMVPAMKGGKMPLRELANIHTITGPAFIFRENNLRFIAVKFSVRGRDLGSTIKEAQQKVDDAIKLDKGMKIE